MEQQAGQKSLLKMNASVIDGLMKTLKTLITAALALFITGIFSGCEKKNDTQLTCKIIAAAFPSSATVYDLSYSSDGKLNSVTAGTTSATYAYTGNTVIITTLNSGVFVNKRIVTLNAAGLATSVRTENNSLGTDWSNNVYEYNGEELTKATATSSAGGNPIISTYTWFNQNLISETTGTRITALDYYTDKPQQNGDYLSFTQLIQGYDIIRNKSLIKSITGSSFTYEFGADGNISSVGLTSGGNTSSLNYQYQCN